MLQNFRKKLSLLFTPEVHDLRSDRIFLNGNRYRPLSNPVNVPITSIWLRFLAISGNIQNQTQNTYTKDLRPELKLEGQKDKWPKS